MPDSCFYRRQFFISIAALLAWVAADACQAARLTGAFASIPSNSVVNLTAEGPADWVHWGLHTETTINRKAGVVPTISDFTPSGNGLGPYRFFDNFNGYSWTDGLSTPMATNTLTGVYKFGQNNGNDGFILTVPADTRTNILKVYVGAFAARGKFTATLSDGSAPPYASTVLDNAANGPSAVYTLQFAAASNNQTLTLTWFLDRRNQNDGNVTLQAATLVLGDTNNPPSVTLIQPVFNSNHPAGSNVPLEAIASDTDGAVAQVEFYAGTSKVSEVTNAPWQGVWTNTPAGRHVLTARAIDGGGAAISSAPVELFVHGNGGFLSGTSSLPALAVDLTSDGTADWSHWGLVSSNSFNHKTDVLPRIGDASPLGTNPVQQLANYLTAFSWSDGDPTGSAAGTHTGIYRIGYTNGFQLTLPADATARRVSVYVGLYGVRGNFQAYLGDFSAPAYSDTSLTNDYNDSYAVHTIDYKAAGPGQSLIIKWAAHEMFDPDFGNVTLQAATLRAFPLVVLSDVAIAGETSGFSFPTETGWNYTIECTDSLPPTLWQTVTNFPGTGAPFLFEDLSASQGQRYYRVRVE